MHNFKVKNKKSYQKYYWPAAIIALATLMFLIARISRVANIVNLKNKNMIEQSMSEPSQYCDNFSKRPVAVMMPVDQEARPLSALAQADLVFEIPISVDGIPRMMAVFQCQETKEIGSIRSAREDFIPLDAGLDAIYAHWGGESDAL